MSWGRGVHQRRILDVLESHGGGMTEKQIAAAIQNRFHPRDRGLPVPDTSLSNALAGLERHGYVKVVHRDQSRPAMIYRLHHDW